MLDEAIKSFALEMAPDTCPLGGNRFTSGVIWGTSGGGKEYI